MEFQFVHIYVVRNWSKYNFIPNGYAIVPILLIKNATFPQSSEISPLHIPHFHTQLHMFLDFLLYPIDQFVYVPVLHSFTYRYHIRSSSLIDEDTKCLFPNQAEAEPGMETGFLDLQHSSCPFFFCCVALICLLHCLWWEWKIYLQGRDCFAHKRIGKELCSSQNGFVARVKRQILFGRKWKYSTTWMAPYRQ